MKKILLNCEISFKECYFILFYVGLYFNTSTFLISVARGGLLAKDAKRNVSAIVYTDNVYYMINFYSIIASMLINQTQYTSFKWDWKKFIRLSENSTYRVFLVQYSTEHIRAMWNNIYMESSTFPSLTFNESVLNKFNIFFLM